MADLPAGHRIATSKVWNIPFEANHKQDDGAPEHADSEVNARFISYCTMNNVQYFTLSSRKANQATYAVVLLGSSHISEGITNFMMNKAQLVESDDMPNTRKLFETLSFLCKTAGNNMDASSASQEREWNESISPFRAKRARSLGREPTDDPMEM